MSKQSNDEEIDRVEDEQNGEEILDFETMDFGGSTKIDPITGAPEPHRKVGEKKKRKIVISEEPFTAEIANASKSSDKKEEPKIEEVVVEQKIEQTFDMENPAIGVLYDKAAKTDEHISVSIPIKLVSQELFALIDSNFDGSDDLINKLADSVNRDEITKVISDSIRNYYKPDNG